MSRLIAHLLVLFIFNDVHWTTGQLNLFGCPSGWELKNNVCYKFESDKPTIFDEADAACWLYGATLLSVNSYSEHKYITDWLATYSGDWTSHWYTSGYYRYNTLVWEGDNSVNVDNLNFWVQHPQVTDIYKTVAYVFGGKSFGGYGWSLVSPSIHSNYICELPKSEASNVDKYSRDLGYGLGNVDLATQPHGPRIIEEPVGVVVFGKATTSLYLECVAEALPAPLFSWNRGKHRNVSITSGTDTRYTLSSGRLTIQKPVQNSDAGDYSCAVTNNIGTVLSSPAKIIFGYLNAFSNVKPKDVVGTAYEGVRVNCMEPPYNPAVKFSWFKFHTNNYIYPGHPYHFVSQSGVLYFSEVQPTDDRKYYCVVTLAAPEYMLTANKFPPSRVSLGAYLIIRPGKTDNNYGPILYTHLFPTPALRGSTIRLECIAFGSLPLTYSWKREDGRPFTKGTKMLNRNRVLQIPNAMIESEGNYICTCTRQTTMKSATIVLSIETKPYFPFPLGDMYVDPGQTVVWRCKVVARPAATYSWFKNGQMLHNDPGKMEVSANTLVIHKVAADSDEGMYQCGATNQHGTTFNTGRLQVLSFPPNFHRFPLPLTTLGPIGGNISIPCRVEGAPVPIVDWLKDGGSMNVMAGTSNGHVTMTMKNDLILSQLTPADRGRYTCKASNPNGEASNSTYLQLIRGIMIRQPPIDTTVYVNKTCFLYCEAAYNNREEDLSYVWRFNGRMIDFRDSRHYYRGMKSGLHGLYVRDAQYAEGGMYTCEAQTPLHVNRKSAKITVEGPPGIPAGVYIEEASITTHSARVVWTMETEMEHGRPIIAYDIEAEVHYYPGQWKLLKSDISEIEAIQNVEQLGHRADQRVYNIENLLPNSGYRFRVRAANGFGRGHEASKPSATVQIPATTPVLSPRNVGGGEGRVNTLQITWDPLDISEQCGPGIGYHVYWKQQNDTHDWKHEIIHGNPGMFTALLVGKDVYYLQYIVKVGAFNNYGAGPNSTEKVIYSSEGMPIAVPQIWFINGVNCSTLQVFWKAVQDDRDHMKGRVQGYMIHYFWNSDGKCNPLRGCEPTLYDPTNKVRWRNVHGQTDNATVIDLETDGEFFFRMQVFNTAGRGPKGEWRRTETAGTAPLQYPRFVEVHSHGEHSILVRWRGISTSFIEESLFGYKVKVWEAQQDMKSGNDTVLLDKSTEVVVNGLQTHTVYALRVLGYSNGGDGAMSDTLFFTVLGGRVQIDPVTSRICYEATGSCSAASSMTSSFLLILLLLAIIAFKL